MKTFTAALLALVIVCFFKSSNADNGIPSEDFYSQSYHRRVGIPLANEIQKAEESRVVGSMPAVLGQFPFQAGIIVELTTRERSVCSGAVLTTLKVLTSAHCWWNRVDQAYRFIVVAGSTTLFTGGSRRTTSHVVMHGGWNPDTGQNNLAVVYLPAAYSLSGIIALSPLPSTGSEILEDFVDYIATSAGYGLRQDGAVIDNDQFLSYTNLHVISNVECQDTYPDITANHICTKGKISGGGLCRGDGGNPLVVIRNNRHLLIGLTSWESTSGCNLGYPNVHTKIAPYLDWINSLR